MKFVDMADRLLVILQEELKRLSNINVSRLKLYKYENLEVGDFFVPRKVVDFDLMTEEAFIVESALRLKTKDDVLPISYLSKDKHCSIIVKIDRHIAYRNIVNQVLIKHKFYGWRPDPNVERVMVTPVDMMNTVGSEKLPVSVTHLRAVVLCKHIRHLLLANGYHAEIRCFPICDQVKHVFRIFKVEVTQPIFPDFSFEDERQKLIHVVERSEWYDKPFNIGSGICNDKDIDVNPGLFVLHLEKCINDYHLFAERCGYEKNCHFETVKSINNLKSKTIDIASALNRMFDEVLHPQCTASFVEYPDHPPTVLLIVSSHMTFTLQQADFIQSITALTNHMPSFMKRYFAFVSVAGRTFSGSSVPLAKDYYNIRFEQMTHAAMMKYGDHEQGDSFDVMVEESTLASIMFDFLTICACKEVRVDMFEACAVDHGSGPFVLYNCARLAHLIQTYEEHVEQGTCPPLPDVDTINFGVLKEEEEWRIGFLFIHNFPQLVQSCVIVQGPSERSKLCIHTHKVAHFLIKFSKLISSYYCQHHILGGSGERRLQLMFARLYLMKAAHQVLINGLHLIGLLPLSRL